MVQVVYTYIVMEKCYSDLTRGWSRRATRADFSGYLPFHRSSLRRMPCCDRVRLNRHPLGRCELPKSVADH